MDEKKTKDFDIVLCFETLLCFGCRHTVDRVSPTTVVKSRSLFTSRWTERSRRVLCTLLSKVCRTLMTVDNLTLSLLVSVSYQTTDVYLLYHSFYSYSKTTVPLRPKYLTKFLIGYGHTEVST